MFSWRDFLIKVLQILLEQTSDVRAQVSKATVFRPTAGVLSQVRSGYKDSPI